ncbi:glyoxalase [Acinetobacter oleivorans]|uniref:Glyoxalase n=1 Tax=Acinetobacter oleivorans TaxID=1148157 RepID=A0ABR9NE16_9GAMM|nr:glyoxalase [Acinetobacter oleivorans]MBE2163143.1 glyoxalase [Acinetobacter oleivorans]
MSPIKVLFVAGFGPLTRVNEESKTLYQDTLNLPIKAMEGNESYMSTEDGELGGVKHFALWPLHQAAESCFGRKEWPDEFTVPQSWIEFEVEDINQASAHMISKGYQLLVNNRLEPWGQSVTRFLSPEGVLTGLTVTPWLRTANE